MDGLRSDEARVAMVALRDKLADAIEAAEPKELAALARQFSLVTEKLAAMKPAKGSKLDELADRRAGRGANPASSRRPAASVDGDGGRRAGTGRKRGAAG